MLVAVLGFAGVVRAEDNAAAAREHFRNGTRAYDLGHYRDAVKEYEAAYQVREDPAFLFNIAQAYRGMGDAPNAIRAYRSYLRHVPDAENRTEVETRISDLQRQIEIEAHEKQRAAETAPTAVAPSSLMAPTPPTQEQLRAARKKRLAGLSIGGLGIAALALGATFTGIASYENQHIVNGTSWNASTEDKRDLYQRLDVSFFVIGGAAVLTGAILYGVGRHEGQGMRVQITPAVGPRFAAASISGSF
jgi:tetratricopeptide (TPR) repeat protein